MRRGRIVARQSEGEGGARRYGYRPEILGTAAAVDLEVAAAAAAVVVEGVPSLDWFGPDAERG